MDSRYTNREKYLDGWSNKKLAFVINYMVVEGFDCGVYCPLYHIENSTCNGSGCTEKIENWLGEYSDD